jgi:molybdopterin molybdotransferase
VAAEQQSGEEFLVRLTGTDPEHVPSNFSPRGEDIRKGSPVLSRGTILGARHTALMASVGYESVAVRPLPQVGLLSTGDEVVEPGATPAPQQIRNANAPQTIAQLAELGIVPTYYGIIPDDAKALQEAIGRARSENDLILMSGGISMGDFDHGPEAMENNGFSILYDRVAVKPGRPTTFAVSDEADLFGLPGNPVSCFVMFEVLVKHYLYRLMHTDYRPARCFASMGRNFERRKSRREEWIPVIVDEGGDVYPIEYHGSGHFLSLSRADGMIKIAQGIQRIEKGATVAVRRI